MPCAYRAPATCADPIQPKISTTEVSITNVISHGWILTCLRWLVTRHGVIPPGAVQSFPRTLACVEFPKDRGPTPY